MTCPACRLHDGRVERGEVRPAGCTCVAVPAPPAGDGAIWLGEVIPGGYVNVVDPPAGDGPRTLGRGEPVCAAPARAAWAVYVCSNCGGLEPLLEPRLDSGTTLTCDGCGGETVVDLDTPEQRAARYAAAARLREAREALRIVAPMAAGWAAEHPVGSNDEYVAFAFDALAATKEETE